jgi:hypothetical protein
MKYPNPDKACIESGIFEERDRLEPKQALTIVY